MSIKQKQIKKPLTTRAKTTRAATVRSKKTPLHARVRRHAKTVLVPHKENGFRPHLIRVHGIVAVLIVALLAQVTYSLITTGNMRVLGRVSDINVAELLVDTNEERQAAGVPVLRMNDRLSDAAFLKAQNMYAEQYWAHVSPSGIQPWKWIGDVGYNYSHAGENLAKNYPNAEATVAAWMASPTHRDNILDGEYVDVGFAVVDGELNGEQTTLVVALYGAPVTVAAVEAATVEHTGFMGSQVAGGLQNPFVYFAAALESLSPVTIVILGLLAVVAIVGAATHHHRQKLPKTLRKNWRAHHGMYTFVGMIALGILIIVATGGGQI